MESSLVPDEVLNKMFPEDNELEEEAMFVGKCRKISRWGIP